MKLRHYLFALLLLSTTQLFAQENDWGPWNAVRCWNGLLYRVKKGGGTKWNVQFQSNYDVKVSFSFVAVTDVEGQRYNKGEKIDLNASVRGTWAPHEISGSFFILPVGHENDISVFVLVQDVDFGDTQQGLYAKCGETSNSQKSTGSSKTNPANSVDYNDTATPILGKYTFENSVGGFDIYAAYLRMGGNILSVNFKIVNHNKYPSALMWDGPIWFKNGVQMSTQAPLNGIYGHHESAYGDYYNAGETKATDPFSNTGGGNTQFAYNNVRPNSLNFSAPNGDWTKNTLTFKLVNVRSLIEKNGQMVPFDEAEKPDALKPATTPKSRTQQQVTNRPITTPHINIQPRANITQSANVNSAQIDVANAQNTNNNAIQQALYLNQAKTKLIYEQAHGNNSATVLQLKQQIADLEKTQADQNKRDLQNSINSLNGTTTADPTQTLMNLIDKNGDMEIEKSNNKQDMKQSMNDFFKNVKFKKDTVKKAPADTTRKNP
jgi:hypothetical protein